MIIPLKQKGFTLLEALITVVVISIGLLGMLGLQAVGLASTQVSGARSVAALEVDNMINRMRANPEALGDSEFAAVNNPAAGDAPSPNCNVAACTAAELAAHDSYEWDVALGDLLPQGRGSITCVDAPCTAQSAHIVSVTWNEKDKVEGADQTQTYDAVLRP